MVLNTTTKVIRINNKEFNVSVLQTIDEADASINNYINSNLANTFAGPSTNLFIVGQWQDKLGAISQAATEDDLLSRQMVDAIQLMENEIGKEPDSFWIGKMVDDEDYYSPNSWQACVQMLESAGYRLVRETDMHKKFRSPTMASGLGATNVGVGYGSGPLGLGGTFTGGKDFSSVSSVIVPVQENIDERIIEFYRTLTGKSSNKNKKISDDGTVKLSGHEHRLMIQL